MEQPVDMVQNDMGEWEVTVDLMNFNSKIIFFKKNTTVTVSIKYILLNLL